jgi:ribonuclease E
MRRSAKSERTTIRSSITPIMPKPGEEEDGAEAAAASANGEGAEQERSETGADGKRRRRRGRRGGRRNRRDRPEGREQQANGRRCRSHGEFDTADDSASEPISADPFRAVTEPAGEQPYES